MKAGNASRYAKERKRLIVGFLFIPLLLLVLFTIVPVVSMLYFSITDWNGYGAPQNIVWFENYIEIFTNQKYWAVFENTLYYLGAGILQQLIGLYLAGIFMKPLKGGGLFKGILFFPYLMNTVAVTFIFLMFYEKGGILDSLLALFGLGSISQLWIANAAIAKFSLAFTSLWKNFGYSFLIYLGAMQSVPAEIYEAAEIDGANGWNKFWRITLPNIKLVVGLMTMMTIIGSVSVFDIPFIMTKAQNGTNTFTTSIVEIAYTYSQFGLASALSIVLIVIVTLVIILQKIVFKEGKD